VIGGRLLSCDNALRAKVIWVEVFHESILGFGAKSTCGAIGREIMCIHERNRVNSDLSLDYMLAPKEYTL
jgi:hypothetical protein